jgi:hypothetical protein
MLTAVVSALMAMSERHWDLPCDRRTLTICYALSSLMRKSNQPHGCAVGRGIPYYRLIWAQEGTGLVGGTVTV